MAYSFFPYTTRSQLCFCVAGALLFATAATATAACGGSDDECLPVSADCSPNINTDFATIHRSLFSQHCGTSGNACHGDAGRKGSLVLSDADTAYKALLGQDGTNTRVIAGDPGCSLVVQRLESDDPLKRMPYGEDKLPEGLRCAVRKWIEEGAAR